MGSFSTQKSLEALDIIECCITTSRQAQSFYKLNKAEMQKLMAKTEVDMAEPTVPESCQSIICIRPIDWSRGVQDNGSVWQRCLRSSPRPSEFIAQPGVMEGVMVETWWCHPNPWQPTTLIFHRASSRSELFYNTFCLFSHHVLWLWCYKSKEWVKQLADSHQ